jgi:hypothetical protein
MISTNTSGVSTNGSVSDYSIEMNESMFTMLTKNVYNDPIKAVIREWSTNAIDACIAASCKPNFNVHLPVPAQPFFSVRDYGIGLSQEDIVGLFSVLGASTKRNSNDYNGTFGIGRLAGLAYADSFTIESFHDGIHHIYNTSFINGTPKCVHLSSTSTDEPNGLQLSIPVELEDVSVFQSKAHEIYRYFDTKPNFNIEFDCSRVSTDDIADDWFFEDNMLPYINNYNNYVLMSNVLYQIPSNNVNSRGFRCVVLKVPTGAVSINPGRESISLSKESVEYLNERFKDIVYSYYNTFDAVMNKLSTPYEKIQSYLQILNNSPHQAINGFTVDKYISKPFRDIVSKHRANFITGLSAVESHYGNLFTVKKKEAYYANLQSIDYENMTILKRSVMIVDVKTRFNNAIRNLNGSWLIVKPNKGANLDDAVKAMKQFTTDFGFPVVEVVSPYIEEVEKSQSGVRKGIYECNISSTGSILKSEPAFDDTTTRYYIEISGSSPMMSLEKLQHLAQLNTLGTKTKLVGIQKKYLKLVEEADNYIPAEKAILADIADKELHYRISNVSRYYRMPVVPKEVLYGKLLEAYEQAEEFAEIPTIDNNQADALDYFNIPYAKHVLTYSVEDLANFSPIYALHINSWRSFQEKESEYLFKLEKFHYDTLRKAKR